MAGLYGGGGTLWLPLQTSSADYLHRSSQIQRCVDRVVLLQNQHCSCSHYLPLSILTPSLKTLAPTVERPKEISNPTETFPQDDLVSLAMRPHRRKGLHKQQNPEVRLPVDSHPSLSTRLNSPDTDIARVLHDSRTLSFVYPFNPNPIPSHSPRFSHHRYTASGSVR